MNSIPTWRSEYGLGDPALDQLRQDIFTLAAAAPSRLQLTNPNFVSDFHEMLNQFWGLANQ